MWPDKLSKMRLSAKVLYLDRSIIVVNKPPNLVSQLDPTTTNVGGGSLSQLLDELKQGLELPTTPYPVHRLDKGTTGCLVFARTKSAARDLSTQFRQRTVDKTYLALVRGGSQTFSDKAGQIRTPLKYTDGRASLVSENEFSDAHASQTDWEVVASSPTVPLSLLRLKLLTGHKHQLRVHLARVLNAPILGDVLYSMTPPVDKITETLQLPPSERIFLHASQLSLFRYRPLGGRKRFKIRLVAPLPPDFVQICSAADIPIEDYERSGGLFKSESGKGKDGDYRLVPDGEIPEIHGFWPQQN